nr:tail protein X [uncultured Butyricicoccus sp.]
MAKTHITVQGDTFDGLALRYYNDEKQASAIVAANLDYCGTLVFDAGVLLTIPDESALTLPETLPPWRRDT